MSDEGSVLITGSAGGIGLALAVEFANQGRAVYAATRNVEAAAALGVAAEKFPSLNLIGLDPGCDDDIARAACVLTDPPPEIIICNAVYARKERSFGDVTRDNWLKSMSVNAWSSIAFAQAFQSVLCQRKAPRLIAIGSSMGLVTDVDGPGRLSYRASKAALHMVIRALARELDQQNITCFAIHPGWVKTTLGGDAAPLTTQSVATDLVSLILSPPSGIQGRLVDRFGQTID